MTPDPADLARFNTGVMRARAEYDPEQRCAAYEHGNPIRPEPRPRYSVHIKAAAVAAYLAGESQSSIADRLDVKQQTISGWVRRAKQEGPA